MLMTWDYQDQKNMKFLELRKQIKKSEEQNSIGDGSETDIEIEPISYVSPPVHPEEKENISQYEQNSWETENEMPVAKTLRVDIKKHDTTSETPLKYKVRQ